MSTADILEAIESRHPDFDRSPPNDDSSKTEFPPIVERSPSNLAHEARAAFEAELFIACLTVLVTIPDICANLKKTKTDKEYNQRDWCVEYLQLPDGPICKEINRSEERTSTQIKSTLEELDCADNFTASDFSQLRNAVLHTGSATISGLGTKYSPFNSIGIQIADSPSPLVVSYGSTSMSSLGESQTNLEECDDEIETNCRFKMVINLMALLIKIEKGVERFVADNPDLDEELGK